MEVSISDKRQREINEFLAKPRAVGDIVLVESGLFGEYHSSKKSGLIPVIITEVNGDKLTVQEKEKRGMSLPIKEIKIKVSDIQIVPTNHIGANPFVDSGTYMRNVAFVLESILFQSGILKRSAERFNIEGVEIQELNWNPFVYTKNGEKKFYQRPFVWELKDKQALIQSIYNDQSCGKIIFRKRSWEELREFLKKGEKEIFWYDIVDGKQRLKTIAEFLNSEFPDSDGNYYGDLTPYAQNKFTNHQLISYAEIEENAPDEFIVQQFLKVNFAGVPQSIEHIEYVKNLYKEVK